jgi:hypothetical protein
VYFFAFGLAAFLAFDNNPSPNTSRFLLITGIIALFGGILGFALLFIGEKISPPDPWLDYWLDRLRFRKSLKPIKENEPSERPGIWATATSDKDWGQELSAGGRCLLEFEKGHLFLSQNGKDDILVDPKKISRTADRTLVIDTGTVLSYGKVTLTFESVSDADKVEQQARKLLALRPELLK